MHLRAFQISIVLLTPILLSVGCADRASPGDASFDSGPADGGPTPDSGTDSGTDTGFDSGLDSGEDAAPQDSGMDAGFDSGPDSGPDGGIDVGDAESGEDAADAGAFVDVGIDGAILDGASDCGSPDVSYDGGSDAGDAGPAPDGAITVDLWQWGAEGAVSLTDDEGVAEPYTILMPEIEKYGWRLTFFVYTEQPYWPVSECPPVGDGGMDGSTGADVGPETWPLIKDAYNRGHEIASHTNTHPHMTQNTDQQNKTELEDAIAELKKNVSQTMTFFSFSYPYEESDSAVWNVVKQYHRYARGGDQGLPVPPFPVPLNPAVNPDWSFLMAKAPTTDISVDDWNSWVDAAVAQKKWFIEELHGVRSGSACGGWEPRTIEEFRAHFDHMTGYGSGLFVAPLGYVARFIEERSTASWTVQKWNPAEVIVLFSDAFQGSRAEFNIPITWVVEVPGSWGWNDVKVTQNGTEWPVKKLGGSRFRSACIPDLTHVVVITPR